MKVQGKEFVLAEKQKATVEIIVDSGLKEDFESGELLGKRIKKNFGAAINARKNSKTAEKFKGH